MIYLLVSLILLLVVAIAVIAVMSARSRSLAESSARMQQAIAKVEADSREREMTREKELRESISRHAEEMQQLAVAQFKALSAELLESQSGALRAENKRQIEGLLNPLAQNISEFRKAVNDSYVQENASRKSLSDQVERLMKLNETISTDARNLTTALRGDSKVQGDWGEMVLTTLLEQAGLQEGIHYDVQVTRDERGTPLRDDDGRLQRPDVVVHLPLDRHIIVDSKVSLSAYADYFACHDDPAREQCLKKHLLSVRRHVDELGAKAYQKTLRGSADYVLMFIPNEGGYLAALQKDKDLWQYAFARGVVIVSPTHLFTVMHMASSLWVQDKQNRHTLEIAKKGGALYDKVMLFMSALEEVGSSLSAAQKSYDTAMNRLATGKGNIARMSRELESLGVKATKKMPPHTQSLLEQGEEEV